MLCTATSVTYQIYLLCLFIWGGGCTIAELYLCTLTYYHGIYIHAPVRLIILQPKHQRCDNCFPESLRDTL